MAIAKWYKIDFHTHTPASNCFPDKSVTAEKWLENAKKSGMNAVVVTDHNSVKFINEIEKVKSKVEELNRFKVFYGIELCVSAEFTHILIIFDDAMSVTEIEDAVIECLGLKRSDWGNTEINVSEDKLKKLCIELRNRIFVIPAHFASNKGLGKCNINAIKKYQEFVRFSAVEIRNQEDSNEYKNKLKLNAINKTVGISGSDNPSFKDEAQHSIEGFGKLFTWAKLANLNFEGLKQVFIDPEYRCLNWLEIEQLGEKFNPNDINYNYISGLKISGISHMNDMDLRLSPYLNCIVGGRGTGKSTLVNAINYGLDEKLSLDQCKILKNSMNLGGKIEVFFNFGTNNPFQITAEKEKGKLLKYSYEDSRGIVSEPPEFKVDFYGQKEIFSLIEDEDNINDNGKSPLVEMIDGKIGAKLYGIADDIETSLSNLLQLSEMYKSNRKKIKEIPTIKAEIGKANSILQQYKESGLDEARKNCENINNVIGICNKEINSYHEYNEKNIIEIQLRMEKISNELIEIVKIEEYSEIKMILETLQKSYLDMKKMLENNKNHIDDLRIDFEKSKVINEKEKRETDYKSALETVKNTGSEDIKNVQDRLEENKKREAELILIQKEQLNIEEKIRVSISDFISKRLLLSNQRKLMIESLELENIKISILPVSHKSRWKQNLQRELGKENSFDNDFQKLVDNIIDDENTFQKYKDFIFYLLTSEDGSILPFVPNVTDVRFGKLWEDKQKNDTLSSLVKVVPEDLINIRMINGNEELDINEGSPGQKSAAILAFILSSGENPLIIDQPEDDLDNSLIYNLIVKSIRKMKNKRQIIIVTHNPNIPVLGDAEGIIVLERNSQGKVDFRKSKKTGCLDERIIREGICEIMEGGENAFKKREEKYLYL